MLAVPPVNCSRRAGQKAIGGGWDNPTGAALSLDTRPSADGGSWRVYLAGVTNASGSVYAVSSSSGGGGIEA